MALYLTKLTSLGGKIEATPYTAESLSATDYDVRCYDIQVSPEIEEHKRVYATGNFDAFASSMGSQKGSVSFSIDVAPGTSLSTAPKFAKFLRGCGFVQAANGTSGMSWIKDSRYGNVPLTIEVQDLEEGTSPQALVTKLKGCVGTMTWEIAGVGGMIKFNFTFEGTLVSITDRTAANVITPGGFDTSAAERVLSVTASMFGETVDFASCTGDIANTISFEEDFTTTTGFNGAHITDHAVVAELNPFLHRLSDRAIYTRWKEGTQGSFSVATSNFTISGPSVQVVKAYGSTDRNGFRANTIGLIFNRSSGNDSFKIAQGVA